MPQPKAPEEAAGPLARLVRFVEQLDPGATPLLEFHDPYPRWAVASEAPVEPLPAAPQRPGDELFVLFVPLGAEAAWTPRIGAWLGDGAGLAARVPLDDGWLLWQPGRAVLVCRPAQFDACLAALASFAFYEMELRKLEEELAADWRIAETCVPLAHDVTTADLVRQAELGEMTRRTLLRRMRQVRIEAHLLGPPQGLAAVPRQAARLLQRKARVASRLELLDGQLETCEYIYELANQRMAEYANFRREYLVEWLIVIILALEVVVVVADLFLAYHAE